MKAPFPYFGGKSRVADEIWARFGEGELSNYVEPFFGSGATLFARQAMPETYSETVSDLSGNLTNFWRSVQQDPDAVAKWCMVPVDHLELQARKRWQLGNEERVKELAHSVDFFDARAAGYWLYGMCNAIAGGWQSPGVGKSIPAVGGGGMGVFAAAAQPADVWLRELSGRLQRTRIICGDWKRVLGPSVTQANKPGARTAILLDPPYSEGKQQYAAGGTGTNIWDEAAKWSAQTVRDAPWVKIALCGYEGNWVEPEGWIKYNWKATGGYSNTGKKQWLENATRECIWFSPACLPGLKDDK